MYTQQQSQRTTLFGDAPTRRTNLFANSNRSNNNLHSQQQQNQFRTPSPYEKDAKVQAYNQSLLSTLESQNEDELSSIHGKVKLLKDLGVRMGGEIRSSSKTMESLNDTFGNAGTKLKLTYNKMIVMSQNAGISWQVWFLFFFAVFLFFFWVWITWRRSVL